MKEKIKQNWFLIAIVAIFLVRMFLCSAQNVYYIYGAGYDDYLIASMADNLLSFKWLGTYNELTLSKGIFSSIFLAISNILGMPLLFAEMLFYAISCVFFIHVIKKLIPNKKILIFIYAVLIFNPIMYSKPLLRVYRDNIYSSLLIYLISFMIAIFLNYKENTKSLVKYMVGLGITFACMHICREETIWLMPFVLIATLITVLFIIFDKKCENKKHKLALYGIPIGITVGVVLVVSALNYKYYGLFALNQYTTKEFKDAYGALTRIVPPIEKERVPLTKEAKQKLYEVSPKFAELREYYESEEGKAWEKNGDENVDDIEAGWFTWSLIEAVRSAGYYENAQTANQFYKDLAQEINEACDKGLIECTEFRSSTMPKFKKEYIPTLMKNILKAVKMQCTLERMEIRIPESVDVESMEIKNMYYSLTGETPSTDKNYKYVFDEIKVQILENIVKIYKIFLQIVLPISIIMYITIIVIFFYKKTRFANYKQLIILSGLLTLWVTRIFVVAYTETVSFEGAIKVMYMASTYAVEYLFGILAIVWGIQSIQLLRKDERIITNMKEEDVKTNIAVNGYNNESKTENMQAEKNTQELELTILMPCLNEAETLETCIKKAQTFLRENNVNGEVLIADNGSTDGSIEIAERNGARVCHVKEKGYGSALIDGTKNAYGKYVIMGDSDDSYDFLHLMPFIEKLREGYDLVMGNRFKGGIEKDAMPWSHKYIGTPVLSFLGRLFYKSKIGDFNCGLRGYNRESILKLELRTSGMEYASEMIVQATLNKLKIAEVPTTLKKDGRSRPPHLKSFRDGWRHLKFLLIYSPRWLFLYPGALMFIIGVIGMLVLAFGNLNISDSFGLGIHTMLYCGALIVIGFQIIVFALFAKVYATNSGMHPKEDRIINKLHKFTLEKGLILGILLTLVGVVLTIFAIVKWSQVGFMALDPLQIMPITIPAVDFLIIGIQCIFASFFLGILNIKYK